MAFTAKAASLLRTSVILFCKLLLVDVMCYSVCNWILYLLFLRSRIDAHKSTRRSPHTPAIEKSSRRGLQVILCGISRSGSASLAEAMEILGFPCFHGFHIVKPTNSKLFLKAQASGDHRDWIRLLHDYQAIADYVAASAYEKLMEVYPDAKVILNVRDPEKWYQSFSQTVLHLKKTLEYQIIHPRRCASFYLYQKLLKGKYEDREQSIVNYKLHMEEVKRHVPSHKLYVFDIEKREGWAPLCKFLEVPVPSVPFPFANDKNSFKGDLVPKMLLIYRCVISLYLALLFYIMINGWKWISSG